MLETTFLDKVTQTREASVSVLVVAGIGCCVLNTSTLQREADTVSYLYTLCHVCFGLGISFEGV